MRCGRLCVHSFSSLAWSFVEGIAVCVHVCACACVCMVRWYKLILFSGLDFLSVKDLVLNIN